MSKRDLDQPGMLKFAVGFIGRTQWDAIIAYSNKHKISEARACVALWDLVDDKKILLGPARWNDAEQRNERLILSVERERAA
jgi:hypothetical protein